MESLRGKSAVVTGATSGVGKATATALASQGVRVIAVARGTEGLDRLRSEIPDGLETCSADASDPATADRLLRDFRPEFVVLAAGARPRMGILSEQSWESFSEPWNLDTKSAFHFITAAIDLPLGAGSTVVVVSSGAAISGSPLSGGYSGAKRMQWLLAGYAQQIADERELGLRFLAVLPKQFIEGTTIGAAASDAYGAMQGISGAEVMRRFEAPLDADRVGDAIVRSLQGRIGQGTTAIAVTGKGVESL